MSKVAVEPESILKWPDDYTVRGVKGVQDALRNQFKYQRVPGDKTIYKAVWNERLEAQKLWDAWHFSLRGIARWIAQGGPTDPRHRG